MNKKNLPLRTILAAAATAVLAACASTPEPTQPETITRVEVVDVEETVVLSADTLFKFGQGDLDGLTQQGFIELAELATTLKNSFENINTVELVGHTDRLGSDEYNLQLSQDRAETVKQYLEARNLNAQITARGVGKADPVVTDCVGETPTPELIACLQPNRRVVVNINGTRLVEQEVDVSVETN